MTTAYCLDVTRTVRRAGLAQPTGIDRVERAYLRELLRRDGQVFGFVAARRRYWLLDRGGIAELNRRMDAGGPWRSSGLRSVVSRRPTEVLAAEATVAGMALDTCRPADLNRLLRRHFATGCLYLNTGHSNLTAEGLGAFKALGKGHVMVLLHDTIPLDFPNYQRAGTVEQFATRLGAVAQNADQIVIPSRAAADAARPHLEAAGRIPEIVVAPIGVALAPPDVAQVPPGVVRHHPYFVSVGTIEPRKNHRLLLDLWAELVREHGSAAPHLHIVGRRGWRNEDVFRDLDRLSGADRNVFEWPDLPDAALAALIEDAAGVLHPSFAEGFGLPPHEALSLGVTPVCSPLPVFQETLGDAAVYADPREMYQWRNAVEALWARKAAGQSPTHRQRPDYVPSTWDDHFKTALTVFC